MSFIFNGNYLWLRVGQKYSFYLIQSYSMQMGRLALLISFKLLWTWLPRIVKQSQAEQVKDNQS